MATLTWKELCRDTALAVATRDLTKLGITFQSRQ